MKSYNKKKFRNDIILIISLCIIACITAFFLYFSDDNVTMQLQILIDGKLVTTCDLGQKANGEQCITLDTGNVVTIKDGKAYMESADCPDGLCIKQGQISKAGESIICLPNKLVVRIVDISGGYGDDSNSDNGLDVMPR